MGTIDEEACRATDRIVLRQFSIIAQECGSDLSRLAIGCLQIENATRLDAEKLE